MHGLLSCVVVGILSAGCHLYPSVSVCVFLEKGFILFFIFCFLRAASAAYRSSQARGPMGTGGTPGLCHSTSNMGSKPHLQTLPQLEAMQDP